ncbi:unnamed protein product [Didymodactylos carnosus]|uniref:Uncharacterized protein n=1 Tax=Didymodactylos carnosus TaxID=1234261 RepID=A0A815BTY0_9BILA|nr:unnamed protein product [Didymodactylos carnosus]CAF1274463.1 unnamed protein product [Didymodactylos carnosus]CAF4039840.1 unnamed protein product [Didymodactylos carnosus]CAF4064892.1 unnamed protein product [Didymodactylos carnosus]
MDVRISVTRLMQTFDEEQASYEIFTNECETLNSKNESKTKPRRTCGAIAAVFNCGIIFGLAELFRSESIKQVYQFKANIFDGREDLLPNVVCYDDACHLRRFSWNTKRNLKHETKPSQKLAQMDFTIDKFHIKNHKEPWCLKHMDPYQHPVVSTVNTGVYHESFRHIILVFGTVGYSRELFNRFDGDLLFKHSGLEPFQQSYAYELSINGVHDTTYFDRRHFQLTWMFYKAAESMYKRGVRYVQMPLERFTKR